MLDRNKEVPSADQWLREAKAAPESLEEGMILIHNGIVRKTPKIMARQGIDDGSRVSEMDFSYDAEKVEEAIRGTLEMPGIRQVRVWLNQGRLKVGDDIMLVLIGGDIRPHVVDGLQYLVGRIKTECVSEVEISL